MFKPLLTSVPTKLDIEETFEQNGWEITIPITRSNDYNVELVTRLVFVDESIYTIIGGGDVRFDVGLWDLSYSVRRISRMEPEVDLYEIQDGRQTKHLIHENIRPLVVSCVCESTVRLIEHVAPNAIFVWSRLARPHKRR